MAEPSRATLRASLRRMEAGRGWPSSLVARLADEVERQPYPDGDPRLASFAADLVDQVQRDGAAKLANAFRSMAGGAVRKSQRDSENTLTSAALASVQDLRDAGQSASETASAVASSPSTVLGLAGLALAGALLLRRT